MKSRKCIEIAELGRLRLHGRYSCQINSCWSGRHNICEAVNMWGESTRAGDEKQDEEERGDEAGFRRILLWVTWSWCREMWELGWETRLWKLFYKDVNREQMQERKDHRDRFQCWGVWCTRCWLATWATMSRTCSGSNSGSDSGVVRFFFYSLQSS